MPTLWSAARIAEELDLPSGRAARSLMETLKVKAIYLGPGRGRGYRWRPGDVLAAIEARTVDKPKKKARKIKRATVFNQGLSVSEQMEALQRLGAQPPTPATQ